MSEKIKIQIVEDNRLIAEELKLLLESFNYQITSISKNGQDAIDKFRNEHPDLVLMDIQLEGHINGIMTTSCIKKEFKVPVIYVTGLWDEEVMGEAKDTKPDGYVIKPVSVPQLLASVQLALLKTDAKL